MVTEHIRRKRLLDVLVAGDLLGHHSSLTIRRLRRIRFEMPEYDMQHLMMQTTDENVGRCRSNELGIVEKR
jgi:hypothetical protein